MEFFRTQQIKKWIYRLCVLALSFCAFSDSGRLTAMTSEPSLPKQVPFHWGVSKSTLSLNFHLEDRWAVSLLQECLRAKIEKTCQALGVIYEIHSEEGLLPCQFSGFVEGGALEVSSVINLLTTSNVQLEEEFQQVHSIWLQWVNDQRNVAQDLSKRASFLMELEGSFYEDFLERSFFILQGISLDDVKRALKNQKEEDFWSARDASTCELSSPFVSRTWQPSKRGWEPAYGDGRGGSPKSEEAKIFFELQLTDEDKVNIRKIITTMSDKNVLQLLLEKKSLEKRGDKIRPVHPMRFIGFVLSDPNLCRCMKAVSKASFKWSGFLEGYEKRMKEERRNDGLNRYVPGLADLLEVDRSIIQNFINQEDYSGLVKYFL